MKNKHIVKPTSFSCINKEKIAEEELIKLEQNVKLYNAQNRQEDPKNNQKDIKPKKPIFSHTFRSTANIRSGSSGHYYNKNYALVERRVSSMAWTLKRTASKKKIDKSQPDICYIEVDPSKTKRQQLAFIDFGRMKGRPSFITLQSRGNPNSKRFENLDAAPPISTKNRRVVTSYFDKSMGRDHKMYEINLTPSTYHPNTEYSKPSLAKTGIPFSKMQPRPPLLNTKAVAFINNNSVVPDNIYKNLEKVSKYKTVHSPDFKKYKTRSSRDPRMPMFMDGVTSRIALNTLNRKMLETNQFDETYTMSYSPTEQARMAKTAMNSRSMFKSQSQGSIQGYNSLLKPNGLGQTSKIGKPDML